MNTTQFMDKQIMDLSSSNNISSNGNDFIDLNDTSEEHHHHIGGGGGMKKEGILPSYDFQPIRPMGSSSPPAGFDSLNVKANPSSVRNYGSLDSLEPAKPILGKDRNLVDTSLLSEIDRTMKKHVDNLLHALESVSARLTQLETRSRQLENSMDDLKVAVGNNHGSTDGKMRHLENMLQEVQDGVQIIKDKQEIMDAQLKLAKLQASKVDKQPDAHHTVNIDSAQPAASAPQRSHQQPPHVSHVQPHSSFSSANAPPPPPPLQSLQQNVQMPNQFHSSQVPAVPQPPAYFPQPGQSPENAGQQQYQMPPPPQTQPAPQPPAQQQYQTTPQPQYSEPPPPLPAQSHPSSIQAVTPPQPTLSHHPEEMPYMQSQHYPASPPPPPPPPHPSTGLPTSQQFYGGPPNMYEPQSSRPGQGFPGSYGPASGLYPYSSSISHYGGGSPVKPQFSAPPMGQTVGTAYQLPTAKILPHALPTASPIGGGSNSGSGSGNRVPVDDVVDKVTHMGFPRDQVRATVQKLTENGQSVDLNVVLDKLMNEGGVQPPRGWFGR